ncbi:MAG: hypothetical protein AAB892_00680 [Patescibacteria group bacterium]
MKSWVRRTIFILIGLFALIGLAFTAVFIAMQFDLLNVRGSILERNHFFANVASAPIIPAALAQPCVDAAKKKCDWNETPEWAVVAGGLEKDAFIIERVAKETDVDARLIAAAVIPEQFRFFTSEREVFKRYFEPLKILGSLSQFSLGVSGIKQETAKEIERHALDAASPFYPGPEYAKLIEYPEGANTDAELYRRLTDAKDHYYSYLYTALYIKEVEAQWERAGFGSELTPDIAITLFNIGFERSNPNPMPVAAGASIQVGGRAYPFGVLGGEFYRSEVLLDIFPR